MIHLLLHNMAVAWPMSITIPEMFKSDKILCKHILLHYTLQWNWAQLIKTQFALPYIVQQKQYY